MADGRVLERVETLEKAFESLATLPAKVADLESRVGGLELQIVRLHTEMTVEFSAVHEEIASTRNGLLQVIESSSRATEALFQEIWAQTRTLHEDLIDRLKHLAE